MSRRLLTFLLSELSVVRVICKNPACGGVVELPLANLAAKLHVPTCKLCGLEFLPAAIANPFVALGKAVQDLQRHADRCDVEFVLPDAAAD